MQQALYVFDAFGTLFDVNSAVERHRDEIGPQATRLAELWRTKQLEYSWVRSLMGRWRDFQSLTEEALAFAAERCGGVSESLRASLLDAYAELDAYPDVGPTLGALKARGARTAILSNGTDAMLARAIASAGIGQGLDASLSVDRAGVFKTDRRAYELVGKHFEIAPNEVAFVSSNRWDVAGATAFGFQAIWINRTGAPDEYHDLPPARVLGSLTELIACEDPYRR